MRIASKSPRLILLLTLLLLVASTRAARILLDEEYRERILEFETLPVMVGYFNDQGLQDLLALGATQGPGLKRVQAVSAHLTQEQIDSLTDNPNINFIEHDREGRVAGELVTYSITNIEAYDTDVPEFTGTSSCDSPDSLKVAIVDVGLDTSHPDIACGPGNSIGAIFGSTTLAWDEKTGSDHGTATAGMMAASRKNGIGIAGVVEGADICWLVARVGNSREDSFFESTILEAAGWAVDNGARVINLSLSTPSGTEAGLEFFRNITDEGVFVAAAAGNDGQNSPEYPASYDGVVSVAATDSSNNVAPFSQFNSDVDLAAPGARVVTTAPTGSGRSLLIASVGSFAALVEYATNSVETEAEGELVECPNFGTGICSGPGAHICLIEDGQISFEEKALNCEQGNGIAALIISAIDDEFGFGALDAGTSISIPILKLTGRDGTVFLENVGTTASFGQEDGYSLASGTSLASPLVAGAAAVMLQACPGCDNQEVLACMQETALDLGDSGKDDFYGYGLLQVNDAYLCLAENPCCTGVATSVPTVTPASSVEPTPTPSAIPSSSPSTAVPTPFIAIPPHPQPTLQPTISVPPSPMPVTPEPTKRPVQQSPSTLTPWQQKVNSCTALVKQMCSCPLLRRGSECHVRIVRTQCLPLPERSALFTSTVTKNFRQYCKQK